MKTMLNSAVATALLVAAGASISAAGQSVDAFAARHFNRSMSSDERQTEPGSTGLRAGGSAVVRISRGPEPGLSLSERAAIHFNLSTSAQEHQSVSRSTEQPDPAIDSFAARHFNSQVLYGDRQSY